MTNTFVSQSTIPNSGQGLFAGNDIHESNTIIIEYLGEILTYKEATQRIERRYLKMIDINKHIDAADPTQSNDARYCNDNADPTKRNCKFLIRDGRAFIVNTRPIRKGEELFVDYGRGHWLFCEDASIAESFLGLKISRDDGVVTTQCFEKGEILCCKSSPLWSTSIGPGFGAAIRKITSIPSQDTFYGNCRLANNPFLKGTVMVVATRDVEIGETLILIESSIPRLLPAGITQPTENLITSTCSYFHKTSPRAACALISGFGPFRGVSNNPSRILIQNLRPFAQEMGILHLRVIETSIQGVETGLQSFHSISRVFSSLPRGMPRNEIWVHFGVASGQPNFCLEQFAYNNADFSIPDEGGNQPTNQPIESELKLNHIRKTNIDVQNLCIELQNLGFPVIVSDDPGRFICNYTYYRSLQRIQRPERGNWGHDDTLFVHIPSFDDVDENRQVQFAKELLVRVCSKRYAPSRNAMMNQSGE
jgi:pyroglutamyl-peptidase